MGCLFRPQLYCRITLGVLNQQPDPIRATTHVDGSDCRFFAGKATLVEVRDAGL